MTTVTERELIAIEGLLKLHRSGPELDAFMAAAAAAGSSSGAQALPIDLSMHSKTESSTQTAAEKTIRPEPSAPALMDPQALFLQHNTMQAVNDGEYKRPMYSKRANREGEEMIPIGYGNATVPKTLMERIDWSSYTAATKKLLTGVFPRSVLATHTLIEKQRYPAFPGITPVTRQLDAVLVADIVHEVSWRCGVRENYIRTIIINKCADTAKELRYLQQNHLLKSFSRVKENIPPYNYF